MRYVLGALLALWAGVSVAAVYPIADANGYTSQNDEPIILSTDSCAGGRTCHTLPTAADCQGANGQVITTATTPTTDWSAVDEASNTWICIRRGDHTGRGDWQITDSGSDVTRKWIVCVDDTDTPFTASTYTRAGADQCSVKRIYLREADYWIINGVTTENTNNPGIAIEDLAAPGDSDYIIVNNIFGDGQYQNLNTDILSTKEANEIIIQNSVFANCYRATSAESDDNNAISMSSNTSNLTLVNNMIFDCTDGIIYGSPGTTSEKHIIENNDFFIDDAQVACDDSAPFTFGSGYDCTCAENGIDIKSDATSAANALEIINNRFYNYRGNPTNNCGESGGQPFAINVNDGDQYILIKDNIFFDSQQMLYFGGDAEANAKISVIGNIFSRYKRYDTAEASYAIGRAQKEDYEVYFNFFTAGEDAATTYYWERGGTNDFQCNALINAQETEGTGGTTDYNAYYGETELISESNGLDKTAASEVANEWAASTAYSLGDVRFPTTTLDDAGFSESTHGYMMVVTTAGTTSGTEPTWSNYSLGDSITDGTVTWRIFRAPYTFYKDPNALIGSATAHVVPYARAFAHSDNPDYNLCSASDPGDTAGYGIDDLGWLP